MYRCVCVCVYVCVRERDRAIPMKEISNFPVCRNIIEACTLKHFFRDTCNLIMLINVFKK